MTTQHTQEAGWGGEFACLVVAGLFGLVMTVMLMWIAEFGISGALFTSAIASALLAWVLSWGLCSELPAPTTIAAASPAAPEPAPEPAPAPAAAPMSAPEPVETAPAEAVVEQTKPTTLDAPRDGGADDLKKIKGVGEKLETLLHSLGFYHFDQVASWTAAEVAWVDENLEGFKGRVTRDDWVAQAKILASGGETEFSSRS